MLSEPEKITARPRNTTTTAIQVALSGRSRNAIQPMAAANKGAALAITRVLATVVALMAEMKKLTLQA